jgi:hypothetical protein
MLLAIAAAGLLFAQAGAQVATPASTSAPAPAAAQPEKAKQVCRQQSQTGSNFSKRVCHTAEEWKQISAAAKSDTDALRSCQNGAGC